MAGVGVAAAAGRRQSGLLQVATLWATAAALVGATSPDCGSRVGGAFITFSVRGEPAGSSILPLVSSAADADADAEAGAETAQQPQLRGSVRTAASASASRDAGSGFGFGAGTDKKYTVTQWVTDSTFINSAILRARGAIRVKQGHSPPMIPMFNKVVLGTDCDKQWSWHVDPTDVGGWVELSTEVCDASPMYLEKNGKEWTESPGRWCPWGVAQVLSVEDRRGPRTEMHMSKESSQVLLGEAVMMNTTLLVDPLNETSADFDVPSVASNASAAAPSEQVERP